MRKDEAKEFVLKTVKEYDVKFIRFWFTDILGFVKSFAIPVEGLEKALEEGMGFDGSSIEGFVRIEESDMIARPDPNTFTLLPWRPKEKAVAKMFCDIYWPDGRPFEGDPRYILKRNMKKAQDMGFTYYVGPELEYFYFKGAENPEPLDQGGYFDMPPQELATGLKRETILTLEEMGIPVEYSHHEVAPSQHEIDLHYTDALTMADNMMTHRIVVKHIAIEHGVYATFMPKPLFGVNGNGMHVHQSLFKGDTNVFFDPNDEYHLSKTGKSYLAGLLIYAPEITAVICQWANSYKRLIPGFEAPAYICWGRRNRSALVRVPEYEPGKEKATRLELRAADPACNPYLTFSTMLGAGLKGIESNLEPPEPVEEDVFTLSKEERKKRNIGLMPGNLGEAAALMKKSYLMKEVLGDHAFEAFLRNKEKEWNEYRSQVTEYEIKKYLPIL